MSLVIVESPTKAKTLSRFLGDKYVVEASMGHVRDLPKKKLGVDLEKDFAPEYELVAGRGTTIQKLQALYKTKKELILATDPDREGEAIGYHVAYILTQNSKIPKLQNSKIQRIVFHEITEEAVKKALENPGKINMDLVNAQQGRRVLDRLVGYKLSPILWKKIRRGLSAGRVQSVAVKLIVEREKEIKDFKPIEYWNIGVKFTNGLLAALIKEKIGNKEQAEKVVEDLEKARYVVARVVQKETKQSPPPPYMTSTLQRAAVNAYGWGARKTMRAAQGLYEQGLITYHRTDSLNLAATALASAAKYIKENFGAEYGLERPRVFKAKSKLAQEAHEAIRPTNISTKFEARNSKINQDQKKLYELIWKRFVASQMAQAVFDKTTIDVAADKYLLRAKGSVTQFDGWKKVYGGKSEGEVELPEVKEGERLEKEKVLAEQKFTEPASRYNEAMLIKALEERGIGRPSTYAPIITTIQSRMYVEKKEGRFWPTAVGEAVTEFLQKHFDKIMDYDFTAGMEEDLDKIAAGKRKWHEVIGDFFKPFAKNLTVVEKNADRVKVATETTGEKCPECKQGDVVIRLGRFGKFLSCSRFPECKYTATYKEMVEGVKCPDCGTEVVLRRTRKGKHFYGCANYPKCKWASWRKPR